jgi:hypothetical protein
MSIENIMTFMVNAADYARMQEMNDETDVDMSFEQFLEWNMNCLRKLSEDELKWVHGLCERIHRIKVVDLESCGEWKADGLYFNMKEELCIFHPR